MKKALPSVWRKEETWLAVLETREKKEKKKGKEVGFSGMKEKRNPGRK